MIRQSFSLAFKAEKMLLGGSQIGGRAHPKLKFPLLPHPMLPMPEFWHTVPFGKMKDPTADKQIWLDVSNQI